ncbi:ABC transporter permease [Chitinimonas sp.]|uniref:ABC transporter permease n=1 Tax=Chitinimonas sp. TaxID=1934313 RepID=UPI0035B3177B
MLHHLPKLHLVTQLTRREIAARYRGSSLGWLWTILPPLFTLAVYTWVFSEVFKARWGSAPEGDKTTFALNVFIAMLFLNFFSECVSRAPNLMLANANYIKKVVFPLPVLPVVSVFVAGFNWLIGLAIWVACEAWVHQHLAPQLLLLPLLFIPLALLTLGLCWALAAFGVYLRDVGPVVQLLLTLLTFLSPVFYQLSSLKPWMQQVLYWNPLTVPIEFARGWLLGGTTPDLAYLGGFWLLSLVVAWLGLQVFRLLRKGFADVL